ncbi:MAG: YkgJ family cysteine cluster protein [Lysobacterales bacterium]
MADSSEPPDTLTATAQLRIGSQRLKFRLVVPASEVPAESLLPTLHELSNRVAEGVETQASERELKVSCRKGCGACCRQLVPVTPAEARLLAHIVSGLPDAAQAVIRERFRQTVQSLQDAGLEERAMNYHKLPSPEVRALVFEYFQLGITCPFLEEESCSIHPLRPLACREYLVVSSPEHCATLDGTQIQRLRFPVSIAGALAQVEGASAPQRNKYLPLIMALERSESDGLEVELRPGPNWVQAFFEELSGSRIPDPVLPGTVVELPDMQTRTGRAPDSPDSGAGQP